MDRVADIGIGESTENLSTSSHDSDSVSVASDMSYLSQSSILDDVKLREIEELRARAEQTEKTMKWWSDCTQNWREKWSKVRNERNKAREECKCLMKQLDEAMQQIEQLTQEKKLVKAELERTQRKAGIIPTSEGEDQKDMGPFKRGGSLRLSSPYDWSKSVSGDNRASSTAEVQKMFSNVRDIEEHLNNSSSDPILNPDTATKVLQNKLEEVQKVIAAERTVSSTLHEQNEALNEEMRKIQSSLQQLTIAKDAISFELKTARQNHDNQISTMSSDFEDSQNRCNDLEIKITTMCEEMEKLQVLNTEEWGRREQLETEKFQLEREIKRLKMLLADSEQVVATHKLKASLPGTPKAEVTELKSQVQQLQLQLTNSKHAEAKCKKQLADKTRDMELIERRCSQSENEVKLLRSRVEMLKKETMEALEENDSHTTQVKKLNRELEDKAEQVSELETEIVQLKRKIEQPFIDKDSGDEQ